MVAAIIEIPAVRFTRLLASPLIELAAVHQLDWLL